jgi:SAM-dependent methyltransferase
MKCPFCDSTDTFRYYDVNLPNLIAACPESMVKNVKVYPFHAELCKSCLLGFNSTVLPDEELKKIYDNYLYISPSLNIGHTKFQGALDLISKYCKKNELIVEVGCSEGFLLHNLKELGYEHIIGIEPGPQSKKAESLGITVIKEYLSESTLSGRKVDVFILIHVFEHLPHPFNLLEMMRDQLTPNGKIIIEVPDFTEGNFSNYNHQHLFYYNFPFLETMCKKYNLKIIAYEADTEMAALRIVLVHKTNNLFAPVTSGYEDGRILAIAESFSEKFNERVESIETVFKNNEGKKVFWWGAGSVSVIYLNQMDKSVLSKVNLVVVDGDPNKWGCIIPGLNTRVNSYMEYEGSTIPFLIIASSFSKEIKATMDKHSIHAEKTEVIE